MKKSFRLAMLCVATFVAAAAPAFAEKLSELAKRSHYHGISFARSGSAELLLASHHGLFALDGTGEANPVSVVQDFMGFSPDPSNPLTYFASGHPKTGGNSGFLKSTDGGATWMKISDGIDGPVDFHAMDVSPADPLTIYGSYGGLQVSRDGGQTWAAAGSLPDGLVALAASAVDVKKIYAATETGLQISTDAGATWQAAKFPGQVVSMVETGADGQVVAYVLGRGLMTANENKSVDWSVISNGLGDAVPLHLAFDPSDGEHMAMTTQANAVLESRDGGVTFVPFGKTP